MLAFFVTLCLGITFFGSLSGCSGPEPDNAAGTAFKVAQYPLSSHDTTGPVMVLSEAEWRSRLSDEQYRILRGKGTEPAYSSSLNREQRSGNYLCAACSSPLFHSSAKFDSGTGWPSFKKPVKPEAIHRADDRSYGMTRTEVLCAYCHGHLGHVFNDGPRPTGLRYCINGLALSFVPE